MDNKTCPVCKLRYSRKAVMLRHYRNKHGQQKSKEKRCSPADRGIYAAATAAADRGIYAAALADLLLVVKHVL